MCVPGPDDYLASPALPVELRLSPALRESCFTLTIQDDEVAEGNEDLILRLSSFGTMVIVLRPDQSTVTIRDNDRGSVLHSIYLFVLLEHFMTGIKIFDPHNIQMNVWKFRGFVD